jgi:GNAT superfamily N-acetyltransferase
MPLQIETLQEKHLEDAAALVCGHYRAFRAQLPLLPSRYEHPRQIMPLLQDLAGKENGAAAVKNGRLVGFLLGRPLSDFMGVRSMYSPEWANASDMECSAEVYAALYAHLSRQWVSDGFHVHLATMMAHDGECQRCWQWLGFGLAEIDGVRELEPERLGGPPVEVRKATLSDIPELLSFQRALAEHLAAAPVFWLDELDDHASDLSDPRKAAFLAYQKGKAVGCMIFEPGHGEGCQILKDGETIGIVCAYTSSEVRCAGIASALLNSGLAWARREGYARCAVDYEAMNAPAARFWNRRFEPVCYSHMRWIDARAGKSSPA